jgi:hypothetical protein
MRTEILTYLKGLKFAGITVSDELPWDASAQPLYIKNPKKIYVDNDQKSVETIIQALNGLNIRNETTTVSVYLTTDAKQKPSNYDAVITAIVAGKDSADIGGKTARECDVATDFTGDLMTTTLEFRFTKLI